MPSQGPRAVLFLFEHDMPNRTCYLRFGGGDDEWWENFIRHPCRSAENIDEWKPYKLWRDCCSIMFTSSIMAIGYDVSLMNGSHKTSFCVFHLLCCCSAWQHGLGTLCLQSRQWEDSLSLVICTLHDVHTKECWKTRYPDTTKQTCTIYTYRIM